MCLCEKTTQKRVSLVSVETRGSVSVPSQAYGIVFKMTPNHWVSQSAAKLLLLWVHYCFMESCWSRTGKVQQHMNWEGSKCHETKSIAWSQSCFSPFPVSDLCVRACVCLTPGLLYLLHCLLSPPLQMLQSMIMKAGVHATRQAHHCNQNNGERW